MKQVQNYVAGIALGDSLLDLLAVVVRVVVLLQHVVLDAFFSGSPVSVAVGTGEQRPMAVDVILHRCRLTVSLLGHVQQLVAFLAD